MSTVIKTAEMFQSVRMSTWYFKNKNNFQTGNTGDKKFCLCTLDNINDNERKEFEKFCNLIGISIDKVSNLGLITFQRMVYTKHLPMFIAKNNNDEVCLVIGINDVDRVLYQTVVEVDYNGNDYAVNGNPFYLKPIVDKDGNELGYYTCVISYKLLQYEIPFLIDKDTNYDVLESFENGKFEYVLKNFEEPRESNVVYSEYNKLFTEHFKNNSFPDFDGVILLLSNGRLNEIDKGNMKFKSSTWKLESTSHPDLPVKVYSKFGDAYKYLEQVNYITFPPSSQLTKFMIENNYQSYSKYVMVLVIGINEKTENAEHCPCDVLAVDYDDFEELGYKMYPALEATVNKFNRLSPAQAKATIETSNNWQVAKENQPVRQLQAASVITVEAEPITTQKSSTKKVAKTKAVKAEKLEYDDNEDEMIPF